MGASLRPQPASVASSSHRLSVRTDSWDHTHDCRSRGQHGTASNGTVPDASPQLRTTGGKGLRGSGEGWASPGLRACSAVGSRLAVEGRRSLCVAASRPNQASASRPLEKFKSLCVALAQRGEAGSASREQSCCSWCVELALPHLTACAAAAVLTAVLARAESFTLVVAGHEIELSGGCSCSTSSCSSCCTTARLEG